MKPVLTKSCNHSYTIYVIIIIIGGITKKINKKLVHLRPENSYTLA